LRTCRCRKISWAYGRNAQVHIAGIVTLSPGLYSSVIRFRWRSISFFSAERAKLRVPSP
jgi:hypothetical protein